MDLDELLDAPPKVAAGPPRDDLNDLDDLISGGPARHKDPVTLDDDFLGEPRRVTGSMVSFDSSTSAEIGADVAPSRPPPVAPKPKIAPLAEAPADKLKPFMTPNTYFVRFVALYDAELKKTRAVLHLTDTHVQLIQPSTMQLTRSVPIQRVIGILRQAVEVSKAFSFTKGHELHMVLQVDNERDVYLSLSFDQENGGSASSLDIVKTLSSLSMAHGVALSVSELTQDESIEALVKWSDGEDKIRRQLSETLAYRTELQVELQSISRMGGQMATSIETLKGSSAAQAADDLMKDMESIRKTMSEFASKLGAIERSKTETQKLLKNLQEDLEREENRRATHVRETMERSAQSSLMRQVAEYEIMKAAHKREIDKIGAVAAFDERRLATRQKQAVFSGSQLGLRIDELEEEEAQLLDMRSSAAQHNSNATLALTEAKKRLALAKGALADLNEDIQILSERPCSEPLPANFRFEAAPTFSSIQITKPSSAKSKAPTAAPSLPSAAPATQPPAAAPAAARAPIDLDDDDI